MRRFILFVFFNRKSIKAATNALFLCLKKISIVLSYAMQTICPTWATFKNNIKSNIVDGSSELIDQILFCFYFVPLEMRCKFIPDWIIQWIQIGAVRWSLIYVDEVGKVLRTPSLCFLMCVRSRIILLKGSRVTERGSTVLKRATGSTSWI